MKYIFNVLMIASICGFFCFMLHPIHSQHRLNTKKNRRYHVECIRCHQKFYKLPTSCDCESRSFQPL